MFRNECAARAQIGIRKLRVISSKPLDASYSGPAPGCAVAASSFRLIDHHDHAGDCDRASCCESSAMHRLHRFADDFFDSHFFVLRFAVGSQCPKFDSQTAMRYRVNYSLYLCLPFFTWFSLPQRVVFPGLSLSKFTYPLQKLFR